MYRLPFYESAETMLSLTTNVLLVDTLPLSNSHNISARMLRLGIAVNCFSALESYLSSCFEAAVDRLKHANLSFSDLPDSLKDFLLIHAVTGLANRGGKIEASGRLNWYVNQISTIAGHGATPPSYTSIGFSPQGPNVSKEDIPRGFKAFQVQNAWNELSVLISALGTSQIDLGSGFKNIANARHTSAHVFSSNIPSADLQNNIRVAVYIGIAVDMLLTAAVDVINVASSAQSITAAMANKDLRVRFLDAELGGTYVERTSATGAITKRYADRASAILGARARSAPRFIVLRDHSQRPVGLVDPAGQAGAR